ncbi:MAG: tetratricopeptide repeat protein, partial [Planctomycetota bacterium]
MRLGNIRLPGLDRTVLAIGALGVLVRLLYVGGAADDPTLAHPILDCTIHDGIARDLVEGNYPRHEAFSRPPLYPHLLALIYSIFGFNLSVVRWAQALIGGATCVITCLLGQRIFDRRVGLAAGAVVALYGPLVFFDERLLASGVVVLLYLTALLLSVRAAHRPRWYNWLICGLSIGVAALARPTIGPFFIGVLLIGMLVNAVRRCCWTRQLVAAACLVAGSALPIAPVTIRNYLACGEFVPISYLGGINLYIGNNPEAWRTIAVRPGPDWADLAGLPHARGKVSQAGAERYYVRRVAEYVRNQPEDFLAGLLRKARLYVNAREVPRVLDPYVHRRFCSVLGLLIWRVGSFGCPFGVVAPLAGLGMIVGLRRHPQQLLLIGYVAAGAAGVILFFIASRYRLPVVPVLALFAVCGVVWLTREWQVKHYRRFAGGLGLVVLLGLGVNSPVVAPSDEVDFEAELYDGLALRYVIEGDLEAAEETVRKALAATPRSAKLHVGLSRLLRKLERTDEAVQWARSAVELEPQLAVAHAALGEALRAAGNLESATVAFRRALDLEPSRPALHAALAETLADQQRYAQAADHFRQAVNLGSHNPAHHLGLAKVLIRQGHYAEAIPVLEQGVERTESAQAMDHLAWLLATCPDDSLRDPSRAIDLVT